MGSGFIHQLVSGHDVLKFLQDLYDAQWCVFLRERGPDRHFEAVDPRLLMEEIPPRRGGIFHMINNKTSVYPIPVTPVSSPSEDVTWKITPRRGGPSLACMVSLPRMIGDKSIGSINTWAYDYYFLPKKEAKSSFEYYDDTSFKENYMNFREILYSKCSVYRYGGWTFSIYADSPILACFDKYTLPESYGGHSLKVLGRPIRAGASVNPRVGLK